MKKAILKNIIELARVLSFILMMLLYWCALFGPALLALARGDPRWLLTYFVTFCLVTLVGIGGSELTSWLDKKKEELDEER